MGAFFRYIFLFTACIILSARFDITDALSLIPSSTLNVQLLPKRLYNVGFL